MRSHAEKTALLLSTRLQHKIAAAFIFVGLLGNIPGCRARQLQNDQSQFRGALLNLYTNQIMDNLIRANNGYPIVQLDYTHITGTVTQTGSFALNGSQTVAATKNGVLALTGKTITNLLGWSAGANQQNQLTVTADPVLNNNEVYNAYLQFLIPDPDRGPRLIASCEVPPCDAVHIVRECNGVYYWVPKEFSDDFLRLSLVTTVMRGQPLNVPTEFKATIVRVEPAPNPGQSLVTVSTKLFNDSGWLLVGSGDQTVRFQVFVSRGKTKAGELTTELLVSTAPLPIENTPPPGHPAAEPISGGTIGDHINETIRIQFEHFIPAQASTQDLIKDMRSQLELIRLGQFK